MKVLIFASAVHTVVKNAIAEFRSEDSELYVLIPAQAWGAYSDIINIKNIKCIRLSADSFYTAPESDFSTIKNIRFDTSVVVSGGLGFMRFYNIIDIVSKLQAGKLVFYNVAGEKIVYVPPKGIQRIVEKYYALIMMRVFFALNKIELFLEGIFV